MKLKKHLQITDAGHVDKNPTWSPHFHPGGPCPAVTGQFFWFEELLEFTSHSEQRTIYGTYPKTDPKETTGLSNRNYIDAVNMCRTTKDLS